MDIKRDEFEAKLIDATFSGGGEAMLRFMPVGGGDSVEHVVPVATAQTLLSGVKLGDKVVVTSTVSVELPKLEPG